MRRWVMRLMPVFMLALMVQILAPIGACLANAIATSDPLSTAVLCQGADHAPDQQQPAHHLRDGSCAACAVAAPFAPPAPHAALTKPARQTFRVIWQAAVPAIRAAKLA